MLNLVNVHEEVYQFLIEKRKIDNKLRFTFRKSNHSNRLEEGYWFYGNEDYFAISFWTGMDWKNRTPNISFIIDKKGNCSLEINVSDSGLKRVFVEQNLINPLDLYRHGRRYKKDYYNDPFHYLNTLEHFLSFDKLIIDEALTDQRYSSIFPENYTENQITSITQEEFIKRHNKIKQYRDLKSKFFKEEDDFWVKEDKPSKIHSLIIEDYGKIEKVVLPIDSKKNQWVFLTGKNGSGKTNLLRAIATFLGNRLLSKQEIENNMDFYIQMDLVFQNDLFILERSLNNDVRGKKRPVVQGLAMYGPYRLDIVKDRVGRKRFNQSLNKKGSFESLFGVGKPLLSIDKQFELWKTGNSKERQLFEKREYYIKSVLIDIVDDLIDIRFKNEDKKLTKYVFEDEGNGEYLLDWNDLSSGTKSTIAMIGDILIRLYDQQRDIFDPAELRGIVIIDEIDLHLHPKAQKDLVINLTKTFPNIQFIVSTHSPIPLLGANKNSRFFNVKKVNDNIQINRLDHIENYIKELLPNALLTSDLFNLDSIKSIQNNKYTLGSSADTMLDFKYINDLSEKNKLKNPDDAAFIENLKSKLNEKN